jgi:hypothetical protein
MSEPIDLNPDGPHSPERTAEAGQLFDGCSRYLTYATMAGKGGVGYPADAYRLLGDLYAATGRLPQVCDQLVHFLRAQEATGHLYEARGLEVADQLALAEIHAEQAVRAARNLTTALQAVQADIAGLGVREGTDGS